MDENAIKGFKVIVETGHSYMLSLILLFKNVDLIRKFFIRKKCGKKLIKILLDKHNCDTDIKLHFMVGTHRILDNLKLAKGEKKKEDPI